MALQVFQYSTWMLSTYGLTHPLFNYCGDHECHGHSGWLIMEPKVSNEWMMAGSYHTPKPFIPLWNILRIFWYVAYVWNNFQQFCFQKYSGNMWASCWKISRYMLRVSKLNIAEHDSVWHHSFCTCLYRAGTDASFFPHGGAIPHCILRNISLNYIKQHWKLFLGKSLKISLYLVLSWNCSQPFHFSPYFFHVLFMSFQRTPDSDGLAWAG